jgi:hypothetical protein
VAKISFCYRIHICSRRDWVRLSPVNDSHPEAASKVLPAAENHGAALGTPQEAWNGFRPLFEADDVVLTNYNGETWPEPTRIAFENFVRSGGGLVMCTRLIIHSLTGRPSTK